MKVHGKVGDSDRHNVPCQNSLGHPGVGGGWGFTLTQVLKILNTLPCLMVHMFCSIKGWAHMPY